MKRTGMVKKINAEYEGRAKQGTWEHNKWKVQVTFANGHKMTTPYMTGMAISEPTASDVAESLALDASSAEYSFEEFCSELGYDTDSREAERIYNACRKNANKLQRALGDSYETFIYGQDE